MITDRRDFLKRGGLSLLAASAPRYGAAYAQAPAKADYTIEVANGQGYTRPPLHDFFMTRYIDAYANEIAAFIAALARKGKPSPSGADGLAALKLADAALKSAETGKAVKI